MKQEQADAEWHEGGRAAVGKEEEAIRRKRKRQIEMEVVSVCGMGWCHDWARVRVL
jgi:hypothetical protein